MMIKYPFIIYIYTPELHASLKEGSQDKVFRDQGDFTFPSPSVPYLFLGENTEEMLPRHLALSLLVAFYNPQGIWNSILATPTTF